VFLQHHTASVQKSISAATQYMEEHATIPRWVTALLDLLKVIEVGLMESTVCFLGPRRVYEAACDVTSRTLCLPNEIFNSVVLWGARALEEEATALRGSLARDNVPGHLAKRLEGS
jgi:hypothetical protein